MAENGSKGVDREVSQVTGHQMDLLYTSSILRAGCSQVYPEKKGVCATFSVLCPQLT